MILFSRKTRDDDNFAIWRWQDIPGPGTDTAAPQASRLYLRKLYLVRTPLFQVALHWFFAPDPGRDLHDHPRDFVTILLRGAYVEETPSQTAPLWSQAPGGGHASMNTTSTVRRRWDVVRHRAEAAHRISMIAPGTLTLVLWGRRRRAWGFHTRWGWRHWRTYLSVGQEKTK